MSEGAGFATLSPMRSIVPPGQLPAPFATRASADQREAQYARLYANILWQNLDRGVAPRTAAERTAASFRPGGEMVTPLFAALFRKNLESLTGRSLPAGIGDALALALAAEGHPLMTKQALLGVAQTLMAS